MIGESSWERGLEAKELGRRFEAPAFARWQSFRDSEDARYVGLCLPRVRLRLPYGSSTVPAKAFWFEEDVAGHPERYLWGNAAAALATRAADSFAKYRGCPNIVGGRDGLVYDLPLHEYKLDGEGLIGLTWLRDTNPTHLTSLRETNQTHLLSAVSCRRPRRSDRSPESEAAGLCDRLDTQLPYLLVVTRLAQHLKVLHPHPFGGRHLEPAGRVAGGERALMDEGRVREVEQVLDHQPVVDVEVERTPDDALAFEVVEGSARGVVRPLCVARPHPDRPRALDAGARPHASPVGRRSSRGQRGDARAPARAVVLPAVVGALDPPALHAPERLQRCDRQRPPRTCLGASRWLNIRSSNKR